MRPSFLPPHQTGPSNLTGKNGCVGFARGRVASGFFSTAGVRHLARSLGSRARSSASFDIARTHCAKQARSAARAQVNVSSFVMSKIFGRTRLSTPLNEVAEA